jgi:hypothetical protein
VLRNDYFVQWYTLGIVGLHLRLEPRFAERAGKRLTHSVRSWHAEPGPIVVGQVVYLDYTKSGEQLGRACDAGATGGRRQVVDSRWMRRSSSVFVLLAATWSCGSKHVVTRADATAAPGAAAGVDLAAAGDAYKGWTIAAPAGASAKVEFGALVVKAGDGFAIEVRGGAVDLAAKKRAIAADKVNRLVRWVREAPGAVVYESDAGLGAHEFHVLAALSVGGAAWSCEDEKGPIYTEAQAEAMLAACETLKKP